MKGARTAAIFLLLLTIDPGPVWGQSAPATRPHHIVPRDSDTRVSWFANWRRNANGNCSARFIPSLELVIPPAHGVVRFVTEELGLLPRTGCNNPFYGVAVMYRPSPGFVGEDRFTIKGPDDPMAIVHVGPKGSIHTIAVEVVDTAGAKQNPAARQP
jgi:hypothetical protein